MTRVLVVAQSAIARAGLESLLRATGQVDVIDSAGGEGADVIVAEWDPASDPAPAAVPIVALTDEPGVASEALRSGVRAVLPKQAPPSQIVAAIQAVAAGLLVLYPDDPRPRRENGPLTTREIEVLSMLADGDSNKIIAHRLGISEHTVKFHVTSIMSKLHAGSRTEAVTEGLRRGLILL